MHIQSGFRAPAPQQVKSAGVGQLLNAMQPAAVTLYAPDAEIYAQGDKAGPLYYVEFGTVRICRLTADGRRQISAFHIAGEVFGFEAASEHDSFAESVDGAGIRVLRPSCGEIPAQSLLTLALQSLTRTQHHLLVLGRRTANERMAALLVDLNDRQNGAGSCICRCSAMTLPIISA
jgi:CRP/FNR family nitrogen fixation transcriptional regulator